MRRQALVLTLLAASAGLLRRRAHRRRAEQDLWAQAGVAPDLR